MINFRYQKHSFWSSNTETVTYDSSTAARQTGNLVPRAFCLMWRRLRPNMTKGPGDEVDKRAYFKTSFSFRLNYDDLSSNFDTKERLIDIFDILQSSIANSGTEQSLLYNMASAKRNGVTFFIELIRGGSTP